MRIGFGFDAHRLVEGRTFVLAGVEIDASFGAEGHSDADVLAHAVADALLGAAALGDLGARYPSSDARWKDADSMKLLGECAAEVQRAGYTIQNVDATVIVEAPKLARYVAQMRDRIAEVLGIANTQVSVKAKSTDGLGFTGDGSGIAASAVALIEPL